MWKMFNIVFSCVKEAHCLIIECKTHDCLFVGGLISP